MIHVSAENFRKSTGKHLTLAQEEDVQIIRNSVPTAVLISQERYEQLTAHEKKQG